MRWRDSNPQSQQAKGRRLTPYTARPLGAAKFATSNTTVNNSTDISPAAEANGRPASQGTRHILCNTISLRPVTSLSPEPNTPSSQPSTQHP